MATILSPLWAVHLSDGVLLPAWTWGGFALAGLLFLLGAWRLDEEELPAIALLAAAFFVASQIHVRVGPSSAHLLLNGLVGVVLGRRAALAIGPGLALQALLLGHGGMTALGANVCIMTLPAFAARALFVVLYPRRLDRPLLVVSVALGLLALVFGVALLLANLPGTASELNTLPACRVAFHPLTLAGIGLAAVLTPFLTRKRGPAPEAALGVFTGLLTVLLTLVLQGVVLVLGGEADWHSIAVVLFLVHLPIALIEGIVLGFTVSFLVRVKPGLLGLPPVGDLTCSHAPVS
jgi:cobalt/nickel transport system permease protein